MNFQICLCSLSKYSSDWISRRLIKTIPGHQFVKSALMTMYLFLTFNLVALGWSCNIISEWFPQYSFHLVDVRNSFLGKALGITQEVCQEWMLLQKPQKIFSLDCYLNYSRGSCTQLRHLKWTLHIIINLYFSFTRYLVLWIAKAWYLETKARVVVLMAEFLTLFISLSRLDCIHSLSLIRRIWGYFCWIWIYCNAQASFSEMIRTTPDFFYYSKVCLIFTPLISPWTSQNLIKALNKFKTVAFRKDLPF